MTREACWRYGIISTVLYEQQKIYRKIILFQRIYYLSISLTGLPCHREPSIVLMSMINILFIPSNLGLIYRMCTVPPSRPSRLGACTCPCSSLPQSASGHPSSSLMMPLISLLLLLWRARTMPLCQVSVYFIQVVYT